ncbi:MAG: Gfo/Idh/MocA family oxidoreductase [Bacteroidales bacterium]|nr:Gfo/Idh/MocA family oxidoreductase [Bacteroidales bacterium]
MEKENQHNHPAKLGRRDVLKGLATLPVLGILGYGVWKKERYTNLKNKELSLELDLGYEPPMLHPMPPPKDSRTIRLGIIGYGGRGEHLVRAAGFAHPSVIDEWKKGAKENKNDKRYEDYLAQEDLNVVLAGVCDVFTVRSKRAMEASANIHREGTDGKMGTPAKVYKNYKELLADPDIDAVIIATPDHWHAQMAMDAARAGKHVYVEKGMTKTVEEAFALRKTVEETGIVFQLGHQGRQTESYAKAREVIQKNILGKINLIEVCTNRNDPNGAWVYDIHPEASPQTIDWEQFLGPAPKVPFSLERFFRWRCWWDYGTGLSGDLLTHEYDAMNQILELGIPYSAVASGGIYFYKDGRDVPDVFQAVYEYPDRDFTLMYSATLASDRQRGKVIMGHDGYMEVSDNLMVYADPESTRYRNLIDKGTIKPENPIFTYIPGRKNVDAVASATEQYFAKRGLLYTYRGGKRYDTTYLHIKEWIDCIRAGIQPSCNIQQGFQEAITAHMATIALRENRKVYWDKDKEKVV